MGKARKYKDKYKNSKRELRALMKAQNLSERALKHTEQLVDEVVQVNEQLVNTLTSGSKMNTSEARIHRMRPVTNGSLGTMPDRGVKVSSWDSAESK